MALANRHICTFSTELLLGYTAISTKIKCADSFDLFLALNQAKFNILRYKEMITIGISIKVTTCGQN